jgi:hypothetical protein
MKKLFLLLLPLALLCSCKKPLFDKTGRVDPDDPRVRPSAPDSTRWGLPDVYATAIVFPDTVNWRKGGTFGARMMIYKNGVLVDSLEKYVQPNPESAHFQDGHLWTNTTDGFETWITCDGSPLFSFKGEERMVGFLVADGSVHTLGQRPGGGICYRVNGQEVFSSEKGVALSANFSSDWEGGALYRDTDGGVCYSYSIPVSTETAEMWEYRVMKGAETLKMIPAMADSRLYDIRVHGNSVYRLEYRYGRMCFLKDDELKALELPEGATDLRLVLVDGEIRIKGRHSESHRTISHMWIRGADTLLLHASIAHCRTIADVFMDRGEKAVIYCDSEDCVHEVYLDSTRVTTLPMELYTPYTAHAIHYKKGVVAMALTGDTSIDDNIIVVNDKKFPLSFNGYFTGVYFE